MGRQLHQPILIQRGRIARSETKKVSKAQQMRNEGEAETMESSQTELERYNAPAQEAIKQRSHDRIPEANTDWNETRAIPTTGREPP
jgi:hypothetical protein